MKFNDYGEVLDHEQVRLLEVVEKAAEPRASYPSQMNRAQRFSTSTARPLGPVPRLGEHTGAVRAEFPGEHP
jgi:crotonobetainyl-CoA:carnitine CoA-transferase CaiB-like acyl-CoA transferase